MLALASCARPSVPFRAPVDDTRTPASTRAFLEIAWPESNCDDAGYISVMTRDGVFLGNVARGTTLRARVPLGPIDLVAWNPVLEGEGIPPKQHAVLAKGVVCGGTTRLRVSFLDWTAKGPGRVYNRRGNAVCSGYWALTTLTPTDDAEHELPTFSADARAGQEWLLAKGAPELHRGRALFWFDQLSDDGRRLASFACE